MNIGIKPQDELVYALALHPEKHASKIFAKIKPEMLTGYAQKLFMRCYELHSKGMDIDAVTIGDSELVIYYADLHNAVPPVDLRLDDIVRRVYREYYRSKVLKLGESLIELSNDKLLDVKDYWEFIDKQRLDFETTSEESFKSLADIIDLYGNPKSYEEMTVSCLHTDWPEFDEKIIIKPGDIIFLAGRPSMGKTDFALQLAKRMSRHQQPCAIFSIETAGQYLNKRLAGGSSLQEYLDGCAKNVDLPIFIDDSPTQNVFSAKNKVVYAMKNYGIKLAIFDYLSLMDAPRAENRNREIEELAKGLKQNARETGIPHLVVAQLSRAVETRHDKKPMLSDLRDSGGIEQVADIVLFAYRPGYYPGLEVESVEKDDLKNYLEIISAKQREGARGALRFYYDLANKKIEQWAGNGFMEYTEPAPAEGIEQESVPF
jgi:replicative DNA helicase